MRVLLSAVSEVLADHLELLVDLYGLHDVTVGGAAQGGGHEADGAGELPAHVALVLVPAEPQVVDEGGCVEEGLQ